MTQQLTTIAVPSPGSLGLNLSQRNSVLPPTYCVRADNLVLDDNGRLAARRGYTSRTTDPADGTIRILFERLTSDGDSSVWVGFAGTLGVLTTNLADPDNATLGGGGLNFGLGGQAHGVLFNFNGGVVGTWGTSEVSGSSVRYNASTGAVVGIPGAPPGNIATVAFGRYWVCSSDLQTINYSALLDETSFDEDDGGGSIDMSAVWPGDGDSVRAIAAFNGALLVFGQRNIVFWVDGQGSRLGLDPEQMYVSDVISGIGCLSQHTVQTVGDSDLLFLSQDGVASIRRIIAERSAPLASITPQVRDELMKDWFLATTASQRATVKSTYNERYGFYLLSFPLANRIWVLDMRRRYRDERGAEFVPVTTWNVTATALLSKVDGTLLMALTDEIVEYGASDTDDGTAIAISYESPWLDFGEDFGQREKLVKRVGALVYTRGEVEFTLKVATDFSPTFEEATVTVDAGTVAEWGDTDPPGPQAEWGEAEWGAGADLVEAQSPLRARGQYLKIGIDADLDTVLAVQQSELTAKIGRVS